MAPGKAPPVNQLCKRGHRAHAHTHSHALALARIRTRTPAKARARARANAHARMAEAPLLHLALVGPRIGCCWRCPAGGASASRACAGPASRARRAGMRAALRRKWVEGRESCVRPHLGGRGRPIPPRTCPAAEATSSGQSRSGKYCGTAHRKLNG
jgi:hypothetical protein